MVINPHEATEHCHRHFTHPEVTVVTSSHRDASSIEEVALLEVAQRGSRVHRVVVVDEGLDRGSIGGELVVIRPRLVHEEARVVRVRL